jgi:hypothetical protein
MSKQQDFYKRMAEKFGEKAGLVMQRPGWMLTNEKDLQDYAQLAGHFANKVLDGASKSFRSALQGMKM